MKSHYLSSRAHAKILAFHAFISESLLLYCFLQIRPIESDFCQKEEDMKNLKIPYWIWIVIAIGLLFSFRTCGLLDRTLGISGCVKNITDGPSVGGLILSQDGQTLVVTSAGNYAQIRDSQNGSLINTIEFNLPLDVNDVAISSDGKMLAYQDVCGTLQIVNTSNNQIIFDRPWSYNGCEEIFRLGRGPIGNKVAFLPGNQEIAFVVTTERVSITKPLFDLIIADISTKEESIHLTDHVTDKTMKEIFVSDTGKWATLRYEDHYELRALPDLSIVENLSGETAYNSISPNGQLIRTPGFPYSDFSQDGKFRADSNFCDTEIYSTASNIKIMTLSQPRISFGDQLERISNYFGESYCSQESIVFTSDDKFVFYSYRNHILKWRLPETR